jgi:hypothetical protein
VNRARLVLARRVLAFTLAVLAVTALAMMTADHLPRHECHARWHSAC